VPRANEGEDCDSAETISSTVRGGAVLCGLSLGRGEKAAVGGKKRPNNASFISCGVSAPGRDGKRGGARPEANLFAVRKLWGVVDRRKENQCLFFASLMALKQPDMETYASSLRAVEPCFWAVLAALWYSWCRTVRRGGPPWFGVVGGA